MKSYVQYIEQIRKNKGLPSSHSPSTSSSSGSHVHWILSSQLLTLTFLSIMCYRKIFTSAASKRLLIVSKHHKKQSAIKNSRPTSSNDSTTRINSKNTHSPFNVTSDTTTPFDHNINSSRYLQNRITQGIQQSCFQLRLKL